MISLDKLKIFSSASTEKWKIAGKKKEEAEHAEKKFSPSSVYLKYPKEISLRRCSEWRWGRKKKGESRRKEARSRATSWRKYLFSFPSGLPSTFMALNWFFFFHFSHLWLLYLTLFFCVAQNKQKSKCFKVELKLVLFRLRTLVRCGPLSRKEIFLLASFFHFPSFLENTKSFS